MSAPSTADLAIASKIPVFAGLNSEALGILLGPARVINLRPGSMLFRQGEPASAFFIIVEGWIKLYRITPAGDEAVLNVFAKGQSFAEAVTFTSGRYPAMASAVSQTRVVMIPAVADFLVSLTPCAKGPCRIELPYDKSLIAGRLGLKPESLSRVFAKLRTVGVDVRASDVLVDDVATLRCLVASDRIRPRNGLNFGSDHGRARSGSEADGGHA
jgi:CRP-like cAMP-binding protein